MSTGIAIRQETELVGFLQSKSGEIAAICSKALTPQRVIQLTVLCAYKTPKLLDCERSSVLMCVCQAAAINLDLSPSSGEAYLIPRRNTKAGVLECTLQIGYQGLAKCARSSGAVRLVQARAVRAGDVFSVKYINDSPNVMRSGLLALRIYPQKEHEQPEGDVPLDPPASHLAIVNRFVLWLQGWKKKHRTELTPEERARLITDFGPVIAFIDELRLFNASR